MVDELKSLELLFDRPSESLTAPKGDLKVVFQREGEPVSVSRSVTTYSDIDPSKSIRLVALKQDPSFPLASKLPFDADFSLFLPRHQKMAAEVIDVLLGVPEMQLKELLSTCADARSKLNPQLFNYCFSVALMHRRDTRKAKIQNFAETFPSKFLDSPVFSQARELAAVIPEGTAREPIEIHTATDLDPEHRLAYFREDVGVNLHHWHWHLVYPTSSNNRNIVAKDRRGELFFYMHQQIIARYNCERLNNLRPRVKMFSDWHESIPEAYYPKLNSQTSSHSWPPRQSDMKWQDLNRPDEDLHATIADMEKWRQNIYEAISTGTVTLPDGSTQPLDIDILGNIIEASMLSPNSQLYGDLHNYGHIFSGYMHDPQNRYLEPFGVMMDNATAMRDPFFYRWHAWVDDTFQKHKESSYVSPYTNSDMENPGVNVTMAYIEHEPEEKQSVIHTYWMQSDVNLSSGLDFTDRGPVYVRFTHLNHRPFTYKIHAQNEGAPKRATCRIFIAPKFDERNLPWIMSDHRKMFIEMDRFVVTLAPGHNHLTRKSSDSTVTIPFEQTFRYLPAQQRSDPQNSTLAEKDNCGCGWPQHMLVPKGTEAGAAYQLFVMLSDYNKDKIEQDSNTAGEGPDRTCKEASSYCGLRDKKYPDARAMGFPFDRPSTATSMDEFLLPNMKLEDITIQFHNVTEYNNAKQ